MKLPHITAPSGALQALFNLLVSLWSRFFGDRMDPVAVPADLAGLRVEAGAHKWVSALRCYFVYDPTSELAADGINVVASTTAGRWLREDPTPDAWSKQATWHIDPMNGSDLSDGLTLGTAIQTWGELQNRTRMYTDTWVVSVPVTVTIHSDLVAGDIVDGSVHITEIGSLNVLGARVVVGTHTTAAWTTFSATEPFKVTADWPDIAAYIGCLMEFTSGPAIGSTCFIGKDAGAGAAWTSGPGVYGADTYFSEVSGATLPTAGGGDTFNVYDLPVVQVRRLNTSSTKGTAFTSAVGLCALRYLDIRADGRYYAAFNEAGGGNLGDLKLVQSIVRSVHALSVKFDGCHLTSRYLSHRNASLNHFTCCLITNMVVFGMWSAIHAINYSCIALNAPILVGYFGLQGSLQAENLGIFDVSGTAFYAPLEVQSLGLAQCYKKLFGVNPNATYGVRMKYGGKLSVGGPYPTNVPTLAGSSPMQLDIDGRPRSWSQIPYLQSRWGTLVTDAYKDVFSSVGNPDVMRVAGNITKTGNPMFLLPNGVEQANAVPGTTLPTIGYVVANNGTLQKLRVHLDAAPGVDVAVKVWRVPAGTTTPAATAVVVTVPAASCDAVSTTQYETVVPGDLLVIEHINPVASSATSLSASVEVA